MHRQITKTTFNFRDRKNSKSDKTPSELMLTSLIAFQPFKNEQEEGGRFNETKINSLINTLSPLTVKDK